MYCTGSTVLVPTAVVGLVALGTCTVLLARLAACLRKFASAGPTFRLAPGRSDLHEADQRVAAALGSRR